MKFAALIISSLFALAAAIPAAAAHEVEYATPLSGISEIPTNASPGTGNALITIDFDTLMTEVNVSFSSIYRRVRHGNQTVIANGITLRGLKGHDHADQSNPDEASGERWCIIQH